MTKVNQNLVSQQQRPKFSVAIQSDTYKNLINQTLSDPKRASRFIASISSAVAINPNLQECDAGTILSGALLGESLGLSPSPQLGQYYLVPYKDNKNNRVVATFQMGYKGFVQLAINSRQYRKLNVMAIKEGELVRFDPLNEEIEVNLIEDEVKRERAKTIGYYAMFELVDGGFRKILYWSREKMEIHAKTYSKAYGTEHSYWSKDFDQMAFKTMLRQLLSKWGVLSTELQKAYESDMAVIKDDGKVDYVDNPLESYDEEPTIVEVEPKPEPIKKTLLD